MAKANEADIRQQGTATLKAAIVKRLPLMVDLFGPEEIERLRVAREEGPSRAFPHPMIELLLRDDASFKRLAHNLNSGLAALRSQGVDLSKHLRRLTLPRPSTTSFGEAVSAIDELYVAGSCAAAGAQTSFVEAGQGSTPDIVARIGGVSVTLEVASIRLSDEQVSRSNRLLFAFMHWKANLLGKRTPLPKDLIGRARDYGHARILEQPVSLLGKGSIDDQVRRLIKKKETKQLRGQTNPVIVLSARHLWGLSSDDCLPRREFRGGFYSGVCYAAAYGRRGDYLFGGEDFAGKGQTVTAQSVDGLLRASPWLAGVLFLFQTTKDVLFENLDPDSGFSSDEVGRFLWRAFDAEPSASVLRAT